MRTFPFPDLFLSLATCRPPEKCDCCGHWFGEHSTYQVIKTFAVHSGTPGKRSSEFEQSVCEDCLLEACRRIKPQSRARVISFIDDRFADATHVSDCRDGSRDIERLFKDSISDENGDAFDSILSMCRLCRQDTYTPRTGFKVERFAAAAQFIGDRLAVREYRYLSFNLPFTVCACCDEAAADLMSASQRDAIEDLYQSLNAPPHPFRPVLPFFADTMLATTPDIG